MLLGINKLPFDCYLFEFFLGLFIFRRYWMSILLVFIRHLSHYLVIVCGRCFYAHQKKKQNNNYPDLSRSGFYASDGLFSLDTRTLAKRTVDRLNMEMVLMCEKQTNLWKKGSHLSFSLTFLSCPTFPTSFNAFGDELV